MKQPGYRSIGMVILSLCLAVVVGCGGSSMTSWKAKPPANPGTAEQLAGTAWVIGGENSVAFEPDGSFKMGPAGAPMPAPGAKWTIENGVVTVTANNNTLFQATFDGQKLIVKGIEAQRLNPSGGN